MENIVFLFGYAGPYPIFLSTNIQISIGFTAQIDK